MIILFKKIPRDEIVARINKKYPNHEIIRFNGFSGDATEITHTMLSNDLFANEKLVFLSDIDRELWDQVIEALKHISGSMVVFWAEDSFPVAYIKAIPSHEMVESKEKKNTAESLNPFQLANQISTGNSVNLWATYQNLIIAGHSAESLFGIMWWKLKDLARKRTTVSFSYKKTLFNFMNAHSLARKTGGELETGIEKLLLSLKPTDLK